jgi:glutamine synthetase type III
VSTSAIWALRQVQGHQQDLADKVAALADTLVDRIEALKKAQHAAHGAGSVHAEAKAFKEKVIPAQEPCATLPTS